MAHSPTRPPELTALLEAHGLAGAHEEPFTHTGFSGATLVRLRGHDGAAFVLKRMSAERDWIMRATDDMHCRECAFARSGITLPATIATPIVGAASDGDEHALLMRDIRDDLLPAGDVRDVDRILERMAALHAAVLPDANVPWCGLRERVTLLTPATAKIAAAYGAPVAADIQHGWTLFDRHATPRARALIDSLFDDPSPVLDALAELPSALLHGDLKFDNIGFDRDGRMLLIDWAMTLIAPPAVELGWFLAINSRRMPTPLDDVMASYARHAAIPVEWRARHDALTAVCGLLLRGWRKALDADEGHPAELRWWCERASAWST
jgi:aminoglycoside phosphotransferase (APT) family kinase protein